MQSPSLRPDVFPEEMPRRHVKLVRLLNAQPIIDTLIDRRKQLGLSQRDVDALLGTPEALVSHWERGTRHPGAGYLTMWISVLKLKLVLTPHG
jgi:DNA-binding transcriptional regulator YiaG